MADNSEPTKEEKIADALRAAPAYIADSATVVDLDMTTVLREGSPDWTCVPTGPGKPWPAPMCLDPPFLQWFRELAQGKTPTIDRIGISYMLMGEAGADFDHLEAKQPPQGKDWYRAGPHVMFVFPEGTGRILKSLGHDTTSGLPYVRPIPGAEPLLVVPVARPGEMIEAKRTGNGLCGHGSSCGCPNGAPAAAPSRSAAARSSQDGREHVEMTKFTQALYDARELAMARMQDEAEQCQATGIVGVQIQEDHHQWDSHTVEFFAIGTAVIPAQGAATLRPPTPVISLDS